MTFFEAVEYARKTGKQIKLNSCPVLIEWRDECLVWSGTGQPVSVKQSVLDATWSIAEPKYAGRNRRQMGGGGIAMKFKENETMRAVFEGEVTQLHFKNIENTVFVVSCGDTSNGDSAILFSPPELPDCLFDALIVNLIRGRAAADRTTSADVIMDRISQIVNTDKFKYLGVQE